MSKLAKTRDVKVNVDFISADEIGRQEYSFNMNIGDLSEFSMVYPLSSPKNARSARTLSVKQVPHLAWFADRSGRRVETRWHRSTNAIVLFVDASHTRMGEISQDVQIELRNMPTNTDLSENLCVLILAVTEAPESFSGSKLEEQLMRLTRTTLGKVYNWHVAPVKREDMSSHTGAMNWLMNALRKQQGLLPSASPVDATHFDKKAAPIGDIIVADAVKEIIAADAMKGKELDKSANMIVSDAPTDTTAVTTTKRGFVTWVRSLFGGKPFEVL